MEFPVDRTGLFDELASDQPDCDSHDSAFREEQKKVLLYVTGCTGYGSALRCVVAISMVLSLQLYKRFAYRLAMYQVIGSLFWSVSCFLVLLQLNYNKLSEFSVVSCHVVAFLLLYSMWVKLLFTLWLTFHLFCYVVFLKNFQKLEWLYIVSTVFFPLFCVAWIPFIGDNYGIAGAWCFIRIWNNGCATEKYPEGIAETFAFFYAPIVISLTLNAFAIISMVIVMVRRAYRNRHSEREPLLGNRDDINKQVLKQLLPLLAYPIIYFTLILFSVVNRIYDAIAKQDGFPLMVIQGATISAMGFFAGLALIVHICYLQFTPIRSTTIKPIRIPKQTDDLCSKHPSSTYANLSTTKTWFSLKRESQVDENLHPIN